MIEVSDLTVKLSLGRGGNGARQGVVGGRIVSEKGRRYVMALDGISFSIGNGERVGLLGHNGSGKTTLLRILSGIYEPTHGAITVSGKVSTLLSNSLGLYPGFSGRKNIRLGLRLMGVPSDQINEKAAEVEEFSELGEFINVPLERYSAGMKTRLSFGIATQVRPHILLIDEVIGAGDAAFINKALARMGQLMAGASIMVMASHSLSTIEKATDRVIWLKKGKIFQDGPTAEVVAKYRREMNAAS